MVITTDEGVRGGKTIPLKATVDESLIGCDCVRRVFVSARTGANVPMVKDRDVYLHEVRMRLTFRTVPCCCQFGSTSYVNRREVTAPLFISYGSFDVVLRM